MQCASVALAAILHTGSSIYKTVFLGRRVLENVRLPLCQDRIRVLCILVTPITPRRDIGWLWLKLSVQPHLTPVAKPIMPTFGTANVPCLFWGSGGWGPQPGLFCMVMWTPRFAAEAISPGIKGLPSL